MLRRRAILGDVGGSRARVLYPPTPQTPKCCHPPPHTRQRVAPRASGSICFRVAVGFGLNIAPGGGSSRGLDSFAREEGGAPRGSPFSFFVFFILYFVKITKIPGPSYRVQKSMFSDCWRTRRTDQHNDHRTLPNISSHASADLRKCRCRSACTLSDPVDRMMCCHSFLLCPVAPSAVVLRHSCPLPIITLGRRRVPVLPGPQDRQWRAGHAFGHQK